MSKLEQIEKLLAAKVEAGNLSQENADALLESAKSKYAEESTESESTEDVTPSSEEESNVEEAVTLDDVMTTIKDFLADAKNKKDALDDIEDELDAVEDDIKGKKDKKDDDAKDDDAEAADPVDEEVPAEEVEAQEAFESADAFLEGANSDIHKLTKEYKKAFKENIKVAKRAIKNSNYDVARKAIKKATDITEKYDKELDKIDSTVGEAIIGLIIGDLISSGRQLILLPASLLTLGVAGTIKQIADLLEELAVMLKEFKKRDEITPDLFNNYKHKCKVLINHKLKVLKKLEVKVMDLADTEKDMEESFSALENVWAYEDEDEFEEAVSDLTEEIDELRLEVYEAAEAGLISEEDKALFLDYLNLENYE
jgi:flagellin-specific chaperone FliS